jgi:hypothetical protein
LNLQRYDGDRELTRRVIKIQFIRIRKVQEIGHRGQDTQGRVCAMGPSPLGEEVVHRPTLRRRGTRIRTNHRRGWSGSMGGVAYSNPKSRLENE